MTEGVVTVLALDLRRLRCLKARLIRFEVVCDEESESDELDESELLEELDEPSISARIPGCDSSSMICCGVLSYR
jgi:hypothetical protein